MASLAEAGVGSSVGASGAARSVWESRVVAALPAAARDEADRAFEFALDSLEGGRDRPELARRINAELSRWAICAHSGMAHGTRAAAFLDDTGPSMEVRRALHATALASGSAGDRAKAAAFGSAPAPAAVGRAAGLDASRPARKKKNAPPANAKSPGNAKGREGK